MVYHQGLLLSDVPPPGAVADTHQIVSDWLFVAGSIFMIATPDLSSQLSCGSRHGNCLTNANGRLTVH